MPRLNLKVLRREPTRPIFRQRPLILLFLVSKVLATSLTLAIGGSGGVFAPSLFIGAMAGMAFGTLVHHLFGSAVGPPALYAVIAMGGVFALPHRLR